MSTESEPDLVQDRLRAVENLEEAVYSRSRLNVGQTPRLLAEKLFQALRDAVENRSDVGAWLSKGTAAKDLGTTVTSGSFKRAVKKVAEALETCRPDSQSLPPDDDHIGVAAMEALIGGMPYLVIVRGPTAEHRPGASENDDSLRLKVEFRPLASDSFESADQSLNAAALSSSPDEPRADITTLPSRTKLVGAVIIAIGALVISAILLWRPAPSPRATRRPAPPPPVTLRPTTAVLTFQNRTSDPDLAWLSTAIPEIFSQTLEAGGTLRVIPRDSIVKMEVGLGLPNSATITIQSLNGVRKRVHADTVIVGSYLRLSDSTPALVQIEASIIDTRSGAHLAKASASGVETNLLEIVARTSAPIRAKLGIGALSSEEKEEIKASIPSAHRALRLYAQGLALLRLFKANEARDFLTPAVAENQNHPLIHAALAEAYDALGLATRARDAINHARAHAQGLPPSQKLQIDARYYELEAPFQRPDKQDEYWLKAITTRRLLWQQPAQDAIENALQLANTQIDANRTNEALRTIKYLRTRLPSPLREDGRIDYVEARAHQETASYNRVRSLAASAARKAAGDRILVGLARLLESTALLELRDVPSANRAIAEARSCFGRIHDRGNDARALEQMSKAVGIGGDLVAEQNILQQALDIHRALGDRRSTAAVLLRMTYKLAREGKTEEAQAAFDEAFKTFDEIGVPYYSASALNEYAAFLFDRGALRAAEERYRQALTIFDQIRDTQGIATTLTNLGEVLMCRGELDGARRLHNDSLNINRGLTGGEPDRSGQAYDLLMIGNILALQGDRYSARTKYTEALGIQEDRDHAEPLEAAKTKIALARLLIEDGNSSEGARLADEAEQILREGGEADHSFEALSVLAHAHLVQNNREDALEKADRAWRAVAESKNRRLRFAVAIPRARALAASTNTHAVDEAIKFVDGLRREAVETGYVVAELQISLAIAEIELAARLPTGADHLAAVQRAAQAKGLRDIARRAVAVRVR